MAGPNLPIVLGTSRDFALQAQIPGELPAAGVFLTSDTLATRVWAGGDQATLVSPATTWTDAPNAVFQISFNDADTSALAPAVYRIETRASRGGRTAVILDGTLEVLGTAGSAAPPPVYAGYPDLLEHAPWIASVQDTEHDQAGFARQRATARTIYENWIVRAFRGNTIGLFGTHSLAATSWASGGLRRTSLPSQLLLSYLAANKLIVRPQVVRINAFLAIAEIGRAQIGRNNQFAAYGQMFADLARAEAVNHTAEIDLDGDGIAEIPIPLGSANSLFT